jgi:hypothetical protein
MAPPETCKAIAGPIAADWEAATRTHPFLVDVNAGTISQERFNTWLAQARERERGRARSRGLGVGGAVRLRAQAQRGTRRRGPWHGGARRPAACTQLALFRLSALPR